MAEYTVDVNEPDSLGFVDRCDAVGKRIDDLTPHERIGYGKLLKKHLYSHHGLNTAHILAHPITVDELECLHYMVHELGYFTTPHTHEPSRLPDLGIRLNLPPVEAALRLLLKMRAKTEARREREE